METNFAALGDCGRYPHRGLYTRMDVIEAKAQYVAAWSGPTPGAGAHNVVLQFCDANPALNEDQVHDLSTILTERADRWLPQLFVTQVLMRYDSIDRSLFEPLIDAAIELPDPSANRDFLTPCLQTVSYTHLTLPTKA